MESFSSNPSNHHPMNDDIQNAINLLVSVGRLVGLDGDSTVVTMMDNDKNPDWHRYLVQQQEEAALALQPCLEELEEIHDSSYYIGNTIGTLVTLAIVALLAGLFLGLLTLDALDLQIIYRASMEEDERKYAAALHPLVVQRHLLLVTLLLLNALAYESLPLFLDRLVPSWVAILLSTTLVLLFGEILPSAVFIGPNQLKLAYQMVPLVKFLLWVMYPVAKPLSLILDHIVYPDGEENAEDQHYNRAELAALVNILYEKQQAKANSHGHPRKTVSEMHKLLHVPTATKKKKSQDAMSWGGMKQEILQAVQERMEDNEEGFGGDGTMDDEIPLTEELAPPMEKQEVDVVVGALQMKTKVVLDVYTPLRQVYAVPDDLVLDRQGMTEIYAAGYSRVPVYHRLPIENNHDTNSSNNNDDEEEDDDEDDYNRWCVRGYLMTRQLMMIDWDHEREISTLPLMRPDAVRPRMNLVQLLKLLRDGGNHMAFVCARPDLANRALNQEKPIPPEAGFMGIVTLEDIMESILQNRIYDELDIRDRDRAVFTLTRWAAEKLQSFAKKKLLHKKQSFGGSSSNAHHDNTTTTTPANERTPLVRADSDNKDGASTATKYSSNAENQV